MFGAYAYPVFGAHVVGSCNAFVFFDELWDDFGLAFDGHHIEMVYVEITEDMPIGVESKYPLCGFECTEGHAFIDVFAQ